ncbi:Peptide chain release factor 1 [Vanrija pseudolonga]|uniref:Peptide chain release factor 1 n=1 Tax=Vanrija pseudolonga TaxID=143232 RepID=A0AAF0YE56_9TREE|nr:Peptide chain release factor 1 [Vanrija pseudolonga]
MVRSGPLPNLAGCSAARSLATSSRLCDAAKPAAPLTPYEKDNERVLAAVTTLAQRFNTASKAIAEASADDSVQAQVERAKLVKDLTPLVEAYNQYSDIRKAVVDLEPHLSDPDPDLRELFTLEREELLEKLDALISTMPELLLPPSSTGPLATVVSLNAGVGGSEASLFTEELARMYLRFAEKRGWKTEIISKTDGQAARGGAGLRDITVKFEPAPYAAEGDEVYGLLRWEKGVHRVQRVPVTEAGGRVHTSAVAVVVLPIYPDTGDTPLVDPKDVKLETMRSRGAGGQHVNKTESAIRLTHIPTGITVSMQDSRSQHQNRAWAWDVLRARLSERRHNEEVEARRAARQGQVKSADRSDKVRTYNFPQDRLTDHRIGFNLTGLREVLDGDGLDMVINALRNDLDSRRLEAILKGEEDFDE